MSNDEKQKQDEREVFESFARICPLGICLESIKNQDPPKPDILCKDVRGNVVEFELGEAGNRDAQRQLDLPINQTIIGMADYYKSLPSNKKEKFTELYSNARLNFRFQENATKRQRQKAYPEIFDSLLSITPEYEGDINLATQVFTAICKRITIVRGMDGPLFHENFPSGFVPCVYEIIKSKFEKSYETRGRLELLIHNYDCLLIGKNVWTEKVDEYLSENTQASQFKRVWIFDFYGPVIEYVYPEFTANP